MNLSPEQLEVLENFGFNPPIKPLRHDDLSRSFVYVRGIGVMVCEYAHHNRLMAALQWMKDEPDDFKNWRKFCDRSFNDLLAMGDLFFETHPGVFYVSAASYQNARMSDRAARNDLGLNMFELRQIETLGRDWVY